jgi:hypothetical protein
MAGESYGRGMGTASYVWIGLYMGQWQNLMKLFLRYNKQYWNKNDEPGAAF